VCGIYGILTVGGARRADPSILGRMGRAISHRGPDDEGSYVDEQLLLGMRRLSIIDVGGGHQPIASEDGNVVVVCNGEIYNFRELRDGLERAGHRFATQSDTEVIVHLYEEHGDAFLEKLEGMFGLALWDRIRRRLIVARDPLGIKPLYYSFDGGQFAFASEAKALLVIPHIRARIDPCALAQYFAFGYVSAPACMFEGMRKLSPGEAVTLSKEGMKSRRFWSLPDDVDQSLSESDWVEVIRTELERAVRDQMVSDVPIGAFLSGGIDSSCVVALMSRHSSAPVRTYSIGFRGSTGAELYNELPHARTVAEVFRTNHREIIVQPAVATLLPNLLWHLDEPIADAAFITTYLVSKFARENATVILSGVGGDELFGGYTRYLDEHYRRFYRLIPTGVRRRLLEPFAQRLPSDRHSPLLNKLRLARGFVLADALSFGDRYRRYLEVFDAAGRAALLGPASARLQYDCILRAFADSRAEDPLRQLMDVDLATQLPEDLLMLTDKMSMAVSLECRVPLLDQRLVRLAAAIPAQFRIRGGNLKHVMKQALQGLLPDPILKRAKRGFGAPIGAWFKAELAPLLRDVLSEQTLARRGLLDPEAVAVIVDEHERQTADRTDHLLALVSLEIWCRMYLDGESPAAVTEELSARVAA
jgi:asparagine synthase (glutamine-hydrolysing)